MQKIGYIFKYSENEKKGILVHGHRKTEDSPIPTDKDKPIIFYKKDCLTEVKTGQLVYFDLIDLQAKNIEQASLANFKIDILNQLLTRIYDGSRSNETHLHGLEGTKYDWYYWNTHITFEYLGDIITPNERVTPRRTRGYFATFDSDYLTQSLNQINLPESVDDVFNLFDKYKHSQHFKHDCISVDILDLSHWMDRQITKEGYYGSNLVQFFELCDIFIRKKRIIKTEIIRKEEIFYQPEDFCTNSSLWKKLISRPLKSRPNNFGVFSRR